MPLSSSASRFAPSTLSKLEPSVHAAVKEVLGFSEPKVLAATMEAIQAGAEVEGSLTALMERRKAHKLAARIAAAVNDFCVAHDLPTGDDGPAAARKRKGSENGGGGAATEAKVPKQEGAGDAAAAATGGGFQAMTPDQIREIMAKTKREIAQRISQLSAAQEANQAKMVGPQKPPEDAPPANSLPGAAAPAMGGATDEKAKSLAALQARIAANLNKMQDKLSLPTRPTQIKLDSQGRTVDASGQQINLSVYTPTLKANLRAKKRDEIKEHLKEGPSQTHALQESKYFDTRVTGKGAGRQSRKFKFNEPGKFQLEGQRLRMKAQLEKLQADIASTARKTGIASATQLAKLVPKDAKAGWKVPDVEWWDAHIMETAASSGYDNVRLRDGAITRLIEHPIQMMPLEPNKPVHVPVFLTKKERKKLRRQNRREAWKEKQDKIRLGLLPPDEAKVKMSNLMRVLGNDAVMDPTKVESHVRQQMAKRLANHEKMNAERKLTPEQRKAKNEKKLKEDTSYGVNVAVYRVKDLSNPSKRFKVETNAKQLYLTGCVVMYEDVNVVVVEGGPKAQKKYRQLMTNRIKWDEDTFTDKDGSEQDNACSLVWEGQTKERNFGEIKLKQCPTESFARDFFKKMGVEHYWDQAYSGAVMEATETTA